MPPAAITARTYRGTARNLIRLARALQRGELVAVPTETVYGLAADALNARACRKIFTAKGRPANDPLIVHIHDLSQLARIAHPNAAALKLAKKFWPGPLTMVLPKTDAVPGIVSSGLSSVAVRMPAHALFRRLLKLTGRPLAAPSANRFGYVSPTTAAHVRDGLGRKIFHILDGGAATIGLESTIIDLRDPLHPRLLRPGAITRAQLQRALGRTVAASSTSSTSTVAQIAPGLLARHYSPRTSVVLHERIDPCQLSRLNQDEAWLFLARPKALILPKNIFWLDPKGDLKGVAHELFSILRKLDQASFRVIHVELARGDGLALAINDRLRRAAAR